MKKLLLAFTFLTIFSPSVFSAEAESSSGIIPIVKISMQMLKNDKVIADASLSTQSRIAAHFSISNDLAYRKTLERKNGVVTIEPGVVTSGIDLHFTPFVVNDTEMIMIVDLAMSELVSMTRAGNKTDFIQLPNISSMKLTHRILVKNGKEVSIPFSCTNAAPRVDTAQQTCTLKFTASRVVTK